MPTSPSLALQKDTNGTAAEGWPGAQHGKFTTIVVIVLS